MWQIQSGRAAGQFSPLRADPFDFRVIRAPY
jgi:hypothetical protein